MTLTEQQPQLQQPSSSSGRMLVFENVVFKNDNLCDHANGTTSVTFPIKAQRLTPTNIFARFSQRFSHRTNSTEKQTQANNTFTTSPPPSSSSIERQNSSDSDLSLSKLDLTNEYSVVVHTGQDSLNTSRQTSELNLAERNPSTSPYSSTSQRFVRSFRNIYSRFSHVHSSSSSTADICCCCCCFSRRNPSSSPDMPVSSHQRFFT